MGLKDKFEEYYQNWRTETCVQSNTKYITENKWFIKIRELGKDVTPYIIEKLKNDEGHFLTILLDEFFPGVITCTGYVSIMDYTKAWIDVYSLTTNDFKLVDESGKVISNDVKFNLEDNKFN